MDIADNINNVLINNVLINTERLYIRPIKECDFEQFEFLLDLYPGWQMQKNNAKGFFDWHVSKNKELSLDKGICFGVFLRDSEKLIGNVGMNEHDDLHVPEFGYGILEAYRGNGYAKEAAKGTLQWARTYFKISSLAGTAEINNIASRKILEYCGFKLENIQNLKVHIVDQNFDFAVYRYNFD